MLQNNMQRLKVYIPSYSRADKITTHKIFLKRPDLFDVKVVIKPEQEQDYINIAKIPKENLLALPHKNLSECRGLIYNLNKDGEWFISADDDMESIFVNKQYWDMSFCEKYKYEKDEEFFFSKIPEIIKHADEINTKTIGFAMVKNEFFNKKKYTYVGHIMNTLVFWKKNPFISWENKPEFHIDKELCPSMEEMEITAQHHLYFGRVLRCHFVTTNAKHYQSGGIGQLSSRKAKKVKASEVLISKYRGFFRHKNDDDVSVVFRTLKQVMIWRIKMYKLGLLLMDKR